MLHYRSKSEQKANAQQLSKRLKENAGSRLRGEGNKIQYSFNEEISDDLENILAALSDIPNLTSAVRNVLATYKLTKRNKLIRIANSSRAVWKTVNEYELNDYAGDSDDDKRIRSDKYRAIRTTYIRSARNR